MAEKRSKIQHNDLVVKSNNFALGVLDDKYTALMRDMLATAISRIHMEDEKMKPVLLPVEEFVDIHDGKGLARLERSRSQLLKSTCEYKSPGGGWVGRTVFTEIKWEPGTATLSFEFNEKIRPELVDLQKKFTQYRLSMYRKMNSKYSKDLYEKLSVWLRTYRQHKYSLTELHTLLNVPAYAREEFRRFKQKILDPAVKEINEKTEWELKYEISKTRLYDKETGKRRLKTSDITFIRTDNIDPLADQNQTSMFEEDENA